VRSRHLDAGSRPGAASRARDSLAAFAADGGDCDHEPPRLKRDVSQTENKSLRPKVYTATISTADMTVTRARDAEHQLWQHYGLTVAEQFVEIESPRLRIRVLECGSQAGEPLVFVQGGLGEAFGWASLMAKLTDFRCISLDRPGGGFSDGVNFLEVDVRKLAVDVLQAVLHAAGVSRAAFVANSMGGWWTFQFARSAPAHVSRMVMIGCPAVILDTSAPLPMRLISIPMLGHGLVKLMAASSPAKAREVPRFLGHPIEVGQRWPDAEAETTYWVSNLPNARRSWLTLLRRFLTPWGSSREMRIGADELRRVAQPTLFVWGERDPFGSIDSGHAAVALMPDAQLKVVGIGHLPWWDEPDECARVVRDFVRPAEKR
jgi:pimeloyl-ACP methyl ester carboxylesterase